MEVHEERLRDGGSAHEARARWVVAVDLRAHLETASARDTAIERIAELLHFGREPGARPEVVGPVEWNPGAQILEGLEHAAAVDDEVADDGELRKWLEDDRLVEPVDERRAPHAYAAIHDHRAGAADLLEAARIPRRRGDPLAVRGHRVRADLHQRREHVVLWPPGDCEALPVWCPIRPILPLHPDLDRPAVRHATRRRPSRRTSVAAAG